MTSPTRADAILDLVLATHPDQADVHVLECISDHRIVHCLFRSITKKKVPRKKFVYGFAKSNFADINGDLEQFVTSFPQTY